VVWKRDTASLGDGEDTERSTERALRRSCVAANRWRRVPASMQQSVVRMTTWTHRARLLSPWLGFWHTWSSSLTPPSEQTHPQNSRFTPRCLSVVLWTPCSGVGWGVFEPSIRVWRSGNKEQAACEPGGGGRGGVPVHPARPRSHRTSPAQALLTILSGHAATLTCSRTATSCVRCPTCTSGTLRAERGWVTAVDGAPQWSWIWAGTTVSQEERHGQAAV
jgi:hypothetical protein